MFKGKSRIILIIIILALIAGGYFYLQSKKPKVEYVTADARRGSLFQTVSVTGEITPEKQIELAFKTTGKIEAVNVAVGDRVAKGQTLGFLERGILLAQLKGAQAEVKAQKETLSDMKDKRKTYSKDQRDAQRALVEKAEASASAIAEQLKDAVMVSPIDGVVIKKNVDSGETVFAESTVLTVASENNLEIEANVPESDIVKIKKGQRAEVTFDSLSPEEKFEAEVIEIEPASTVIQDVVYYEIKLRLSQSDPRLKAGMSCDIDIRTAEKGNVLMIPLRAVRTEDGEKLVEVLKPDNTTEKVRIETGLVGDEGMVEVTSGITEGEKVVTFTKSQ